MRFLYTLVDKQENNRHCLEVVPVMESEFLPHSDDHRYDEDEAHLGLSCSYYLNPHYGATLEKLSYSTDISKRWPHIEKLYKSYIADIRSRYDYLRPLFDADKDKEALEAIRYSEIKNWPLDVLERVSAYVDQHEQRDWTIRQSAPLHFDKTDEVKLDQLIAESYFNPAYQFKIDTVSLSGYRLFDDKEKVVLSGKVEHHRIDLYASLDTSGRLPKYILSHCIIYPHDTIIEDVIIMPRSFNHHRYTYIDLREIVRHEISSLTLNWLIYDEISDRLADLLVHMLRLLRPEIIAPKMGYYTCMPMLAGLYDHDGSDDDECYGKDVHLPEYRAYYASTLVKDRYLVNQMALFPEVNSGNLLFYCPLIIDSQLRFWLSLGKYKTATCEIDRLGKQMALYCKGNAVKPLIEVNLNHIKTQVVSDLRYYSARLLRKDDPKMIYHVGDQLSREIDNSMTITVPVYDGSTKVSDKTYTGDEIVELVNSRIAEHKEVHHIHDDKPKSE